MKKGFIITLSLLFLILFIAFNIVNIDVKIEKIDFGIIFTFIIIAIICLSQIILDKQKFSLNKVLWYFNLFFLFISPMIQYLTNYSPWRYKLKEEDMLECNILIIFVFLIYIIFYKFFFKVKKEENVESRGVFLYNNNKLYQTIIFTLSIICFLILLLNIGFSGFFNRGSNYTDIVESSALNSVITCFCRSFPVYAFTILFYLNKKYKGNVNRLYLYSSFILLIISNFPTSITRFWMGAIYIGILLIMYSKKINRRTFDVIFCLTFLVLFPIFATFKRTSLEEFSFSNINRLGIVEAYNSTDYDAYSIIVRSIEYIKDNGNCYGKQIIGTLFFFIPRSIWKTKPIASGALIAESQGQWYTNISCPYIAEGIINFGIIGAFLFTIILCYFIKKMDTKYWKLQVEEQSNKIYYIQLYYPYFIGFMIFLLRGALHHAIVYISGFCLPIIVISLIKNILNKKGEKNERA